MMSARSIRSRGPRILAALGVTVLGLVSCQGRTAERALSTQALRARLEAQAEAWDEAIIRKDRTAIEANMAADFLFIDARGLITDRANFIETMMDSAFVIDPYAVEDFDLRLYGDVALLCGRTQMTGSWAGEPFTSHYRYIDVYARQGEDWKVVSVQITAMAD